MRLTACRRSPGPPAAGLALLAAVALVGLQRPRVRPGSRRRRGATSPTALSAGELDGRRLRGRGRRGQAGSHGVRRDHRRHRRRRGLGRRGLDRRRHAPPASSPGAGRSGRRPGPTTPTVELTKGETADGDAWLVRWSPDPRGAVAEGRRAAVPRRTIKAERGEILGAGDQPIVTLRPVLRVGLDKTGLSAAQATDSARRLATPASTSTPRRFVKQVTAGGPKAFVQGIVYRAARMRRPTCSPAGRHPGRAEPSPTSCRSRRPRTSPPRSWARSAPRRPSWSRTARAGSRPGDDVGLSGLQKRYDEQLAGTRGATVAAVDDEGERRDPVHGRPEGRLRRCSTTIDLDAQSAAQQALAGVGPASALVADPALDRRPRRGGQRTRLEGLQHRHLRPLRARAPPSRWSPRSPCCAPASPRRPGCRARRRRWSTARRFKNYDDYPSSGIGEISFEDAAGQLVQHRLHRPARQARAEVARRGGRCPRPRRRPRHRLPDLLRRGRHARQRDPGRRQHDRAGHGARLADGHGHGRGVGGQGLGGRSRGCCPTTRRSRRSRPSRSPLPRTDSSAR